MKKIKFELPIILYLIFLLLIHRFFMVIGDDFTSYVSQGSTLIEKVKIIFDERWWEYLNWNSRFPMLFLNSLLLITRENLLWKILNPFIIVSLIILIVRNFQAYYPKGKEKAFHYILAIMLLGLIPLEARIQTLYWQNGSMHYLWTAVIVLGFSVPYVAIINNKGDVSNKNLGFSFIQIVFGVLAGWSHENAALVAFGIIVFTIIHQILRKKKIPTYLYYGLFGVIVGLYFLYFYSNGQEIRLKMPMYTIWTEYRFISKIFYGFGVFVYVYFIKYYILNLILLILLSMRIYNSNINKYIKYFIYGVFGIFILLFIPDIDFPGMRYLLYYREDVINLKMLARILTYGGTCLTMLLATFMISKEDDNYSLFMFMGASLAASLVMILTPSNAVRQTFISMACNLIVILYLLKDNKLINKYSKIVAVVAVVIILVTHGRQYESFGRMHKTDLERRAILKYDRENGFVNDVIHLPAVDADICGPNCGNEIDDADWVEDWYKYYYNIPQEIKIEINDQD